MSAPISPSTPSGDSSISTSAAAAAEKAVSQATFAGESSNIDPTGVWTKFLSSGGQQATPKEVHAFINGILKNLNAIIQQQAKQAAEDARRMKRAIQGQ